MAEKNVIKPTSVNLAEKHSSAGEITAFLKTAKSSNPNGAGRLAFALDATMSRQPTWDRAMNIQSSMFDAVDEVSGTNGGLAVQLIYFRGHGECRASKWVIKSSALRDLMIRIDCRGGKTQIGKVLSHVYKETQDKKVDALVYIGDAMEENIDMLCDQAGKLGLKGAKCFIFQEGNDPVTERAFKEIARLTRGAYFKLGPNSAKELAELLAAIAVYAKGGLKALESSTQTRGQQLLKQLK
ncbi:MAG: VWA domain-containing protein [Salaquimonas sp.]